jgi:hypothetical protein
LQGRLKRDVPDAPGWCLARSLLACRWDVDVRTRRVGRGRAVVACDVGAVTHIYFVHKLFPPLSLHPRFTARTHAPGRTLFFARCLFCVAYLCGAPYFCTRMTNQSAIRTKAHAQAQLNEVLSWTDNNPMKKTLLPMLQAEVARFEQAEASAARAAKAKADHEAKCAEYNALPFFRRLFAVNPAA